MVDMVEIVSENGRRYLASRSERESLAMAMCGCYSI
jgi:hypothetical protein